MYSNDFRWRATVLLHVYGVNISYVSDILGPSVRSLERWYLMFLKRGTVQDGEAKERSSRWPAGVLADVSAYVKAHPTFFLEELRAFLKAHHPELKNISLSTICRALNFDLNLSRKVLTKAARECVLQEVENYKAKLEPIYSFPQQLLFIDETSKDRRHAYRRYSWSKRNTPAIVKLPFRRGKRVSIFAALDYRGFVSWEMTIGTFTRRTFHDAIVRQVFPLLNPWPLPRSIVVIDNAKILMYEELEKVIHMAGARLIYLSPYSPHLNPIEFAFGRLKAWVQKHANLVFPLYPELVLKVAMPKCCESTGFLGVYAHCGYEYGELKEIVFGAGN